MSGQMADAVNERDSPPPTTKRAVCRKTVEKWIKENDRSLNTTVWLKFDSDSHDHVNTLSCEVCSRYKLIGMRNYHPAFVEGTSNVRASSFKDHAVIDMHTRAMALFRNSATNVTESPIVTSFLRSSMDPTTQDQMGRVDLIRSHIITVHM